MNDIHFKFDDHTLRLIENLQEELNIPTRADVLKRALALLNFANDQRKLGAEMIFEAAEMQKKAQRTKVNIMSE